MPWVKPKFMLAMALLAPVNPSTLGLLTIMSNSWLFAFVGFRCSVTESPTKVSTGKLDET